MPAAAARSIIAPSDETADAAEIVEKFLVASMVPDPETAARYIAEPLRLTGVDDPDAAGDEDDEDDDEPVGAGAGRRRSRRGGTRRRTRP